MPCRKLLSFALAWCMIQGFCGGVGAQDLHADLGSVPALEVRNLDNGLVRLVGLATHEKALGEEEAPLRLKFRVRNVSAEPIRFLELEAQVFSKDGRLRGFYGFTVKEELAAGEDRFFLHRTSRYSLSPGDLVVLSPVQIVGTRERWELRPAEDMGDTEPLGVFQRVEGLTCDTRCENAEGRCDARCNNTGFYEFSCSCTEGGTFSYTCKCSTDRPPL